MLPSWWAGSYSGSPENVPRRVTRVCRLAIHTTVWLARTRQTKDNAKGRFWGQRRRWQLMAGSGRKNADEALALALAAGVSVQEAARQAGLSDRAAARRL